MDLPYDANEKIIKILDNVWYSSKKHVETNLKLFLKEDEGKLYLTNKSAIFRGKKKTIKIQNITNIQRREIERKPGSGEGYVQIDFQEDDGSVESIFFIKAGFTIWEVSEGTNVLFGTLQEWWNDFMNGYTLLQEQYECPTCRGQLSYIQEYSRWYCYSCKNYV